MVVVGYFVQSSPLPAEAFVRGISRRAVGRVAALLTEEVVSATTVSKLTRDVDDAVRAFHEVRLSDDHACWFLDGVSLRVRRPAGRKRVQLLVAYRVRRDGTRHLLAFLRRRASQADWEGLLGICIGAGWRAGRLGLIVSDGCPGLAAAIPTSRDSIWNGKPAPSTYLQKQLDVTGIWVMVLL